MALSFQLLMYLSILLVEIFNKFEASSLVNLYILVNIKTKIITSKISFFLKLSTFLNVYA